MPARGKRTRKTAGQKPARQKGKHPGVANLRRGGGRPKGVPNKVTREVRELAGRLFDEEYWALKKLRLAEGKENSAIERELLHYAYGKPKDVVELSGPDGGPIRAEALKALDGTELGVLHKILSKVTA